MSLPRFFTRNLGWKVIALVAATLVWMALKSETPPRRPVGSVRSFGQLPIAVLATPEDGRSFEIEPGTVDVEVRGPPEVLPRLHTNDFRAFVDLTPAADARLLRLRVKVHAPAGITLEKVSPAEVTGRILPLPTPES